VGLNPGHIFGWGSKAVGLTLKTQFKSFKLKKKIQNYLHHKDLFQLVPELLVQDVPLLVMMADQQLTLLL
jgi:hypothetical protein